MRKLKVLLLAFVLLAPMLTVKSQILISLIFGDKLNTPKLEFGLDGGVNFLYMSNIEDSKSLFNWNLGFYFDYKLKEKLYLHTGIIVKSRMGASNVQPYSVGNAHVDSVFDDGTVFREVNYFNLPIFIRYRFINYFHVEGGLQFGLRYTAFDNFAYSVYDNNDATFEYNTQDNYTRLDAGMVVGLGYKLHKGEGITLSARYYYGFVDVDKITEDGQRNSAIYLNASIPIGRAKVEKEAE
jgi:hypothetical protein